MKSTLDSVILFLTGETSATKSMQVIKIGIVNYTKIPGIKENNLGYILRKPNASSGDCKRRVSKMLETQ